MRGVENAAGDDANTAEYCMYLFIYWRLCNRLQYRIFDVVSVANSDPSIYFKHCTVTNFDIATLKELRYEGATQFA